MSSTLVITVVVIAAIGWLAFLAVSALRSRGPEEIPANLKPGVTDDQMETRRLERSQQAAVLLSAFLAIGLPLYYLGENDRQEGFVEQFDEESVERGLHLVEEFGCFNCHGPDGVGGVASFVERRTGMTVSWAAPSINDIFYRYDRDEIDYWITFGRGNTPMPAWGLEGGGPMNEQQVDDVINYLETIQIPQEQVAAQVDNLVTSELQRLDTAEQAMAQLILRQRQVIAEIERAEDLTPIAQDLADRAGELLATLSEGLDTDGDGVADTVEEAVTTLLAEARTAFLPPELTEDFGLDPAAPETNGIPDLQAAENVLATLRLLADDEFPIVAVQADAIEAILEGEPEPTDGTAAEGETTETTVAEGETTETTAAEGEATETTAAPQEPVDQDGDGLTDQQEQQIVAQLEAAIAEILPDDLVVVELDPTLPETQGGESDAVVARRALNALETIALNLDVQTANLDRILPAAIQTLDELLELEEAERWEFDFEAIAEQAFGGDVEQARRVVGVFNAFCARCHTAGYSAGVPFAQEAGAGGFGPALWDGRPAVQFLSDEDLIAFLIEGSEDAEPYGANGFGTGRMPGWGLILSAEDIAALSHWLRLGDLTGQGEVGRAEEVEP